MTLDAEAIAREVQRRLRADLGDGWMLSRNTQRLLAEAVDVGMGEAMLHWRDFAGHEDGFKRAARRATDRAKTWLRRENARSQTEQRSYSHALRLAGALYGRGEAAMPDGAADVPVLVQLELEQLRRLVDALGKPERLVIEARYWHGGPGMNMPWRDVARMVTKSINTVRVTHERALNELRSWLA